MLIRFPAFVCEGSAVTIQNIKAALSDPHSFWKLCRRFRKPTSRFDEVSCVWVRGPRGPRSKTTRSLLAIHIHSGIYVGASKSRPLGFDKVCRGGSTVGPGLAASERLAEAAQAVKPASRVFKEATVKAVNLCFSGQPLRSALPRRPFRRAWAGRLGAFCRGGPGLEAYKPYV